MLIVLSGIKRAFKDFDQFVLFELKLYMLLATCVDVTQHFHTNMYLFSSLKTFSCAISSTNNKSSFIKYCCSNTNK